jgi:hypothetical protein
VQWLQEVSGKVQVVAEPASVNIPVV